MRSSRCGCSRRRASPCSTRTSAAAAGASSCSSRTRERPGYVSSDGGDMDEIEIDREALLQTFLEEAEETFVHMEQALVALESRPDDDELLHGLFRDAHTVKGAAGLVAFDTVRDLSHDLESVLERLRKKTLPVTDVLVTLLLHSVDVLRGAVSSAAGGAQAGSDVVTAFRVRLAEAAAAAAPEARAWAPGAPPSPPPGSGGGDGGEAPTPQPPAGGGRSLRVDMTKLDRMLDLSGEIAIARGRLGEMLERGAASHAEILEAHRETDRLYLDLQELIMKARMVPIGPSFHQHVRTVRDVATSQSKQARLVVEGEDVEVDTAVVGYVCDPLMHMVRNALDHGIESPDARRAAGKDPTARSSFARITRRSRWGSPRTACASARRTSRASCSSLGSPPQRR